MKKKILFTGMSSYLGKNLQPLINQLKGFDLICYSRRPIPGIKTIVGDLSEADKIIRAMSGVDIVVHMASETSGEDREKLKSTNVVGTQNLVYAAKYKKVKRFIYISSISVMHYLGTPYPDSKKAAEEIVKRNFSNYAIIRPTEIYGGLDSKHFGLHIDQIKNNRFFFSSRGNHYIQPVYVGDVARAIIRTIKLDEFRGTYISAGRAPILKSTLYKMIRDKFNKKCILIFVQDIMAFLAIKLFYPLIGKKKSWKDYKDGLIDRKYRSDFDAISFKEGLNYLN